MKTTLFLASVIFAGLCVSQSQAQNVVLLGGPAVYSAPPVVYQSPVTYQVPVIYQAPVVYQSAVVYQAPVVQTVPAVPCYPSSPNVVYVGGSEYCAPHYYGYGSPNVIYFGSGQGYRQGYNFRHYR